MADTPTQPHSAPATEQPRPCVACRYDLRGLGDEPRCPECGLLNVPQGYREQVWELIDSRWWTYSSFLNPFARRPAGWWWSLDRPGDVKRSFVFAGVCVLVMFALMAAGVLLDDSIHLVEVAERSYHHPDDPPGVHRVIDRHTWSYGALGCIHPTQRVRGSYMQPRTNPAGRLPPIQSTETYSIRLCTPSTYEMTAVGWAGLFAFWVWLAPAVVGIWTQIRNGLPDFARAPRTIIAAANYEAHRLVYIGWAWLGAYVLDVVLRLTLLRTTTGWYDYWAMGFTLPLPLLVLANWIGPLRSDYTRQLIRSRWHAVRIFVMYVLVLPTLLMLSAVVVVFFVGRALGAEQVLPLTDLYYYLRSRYY